MQLHFVSSVIIFKFIFNVQASPIFNQVSNLLHNDLPQNEVYGKHNFAENNNRRFYVVNGDSSTLYNNNFDHTSTSTHERLLKNPNAVSINFIENNLKRPKRSNKNTTMKGSAVQTLDKTMSESQFDGSYDSTRLRSEETPSTDGIINTTSDYVLIAMIVAMMFCMTLCCLCLFCRSSSRLSICGINFELNDRQNSLANEDLSEIHEVVPLTPTTADNNRLPDIDALLRNDAPPPLYSELMTKKRNSSKQKKETSDQIKIDKIAEANELPKKIKSKKTTESQSKKNAESSSSTSSSSNHKSSWRKNGLFNSLRKKKSQTTDTKKPAATATKPIPIPEQPQDKVFVYDTNETDDDVFI